MFDYPRLYWFSLLRRQPRLNDLDHICTPEPEQIRRPVDALGMLPPGLKTVCSGSFQTANRLFRVSRAQQKQRQQTGDQEGSQSVDQTTAWRGRGPPAPDHG
jgi:hypothetical protein